jgi:hypothetical protein
LANDVSGLEMTLGALGSAVDIMDCKRQSWISPLADGTFRLIQQSREFLKDDAIGACSKMKQKSVAVMFDTLRPAMQHE